MLAVAYRHSDLGLEQSLKRSFQLFERAAAQGHAASQLTLGNCYHTGDGVDKDHEAAVLWYRTAAEQGYPPAQCNLGQLIPRLRRGPVVRGSREVVPPRRSAGRAKRALQTRYLLWTGPRRAAEHPQGAALSKRAAAQGHAGAAVECEGLEARAAAFAAL